MYIELDGGRQAGREGARKGGEGRMGEDGGGKERGRMGKEGARKDGGGKE